MSRMHVCLQNIQYIQSPSPVENLPDLSGSAVFLDKNDPAYVFQVYIDNISKYMNFTTLQHYQLPQEKVNILFCSRHYFCSNKPVIVDGRSHTCKSHDSTPRYDMICIFTLLTPSLDTTHHDDLTLTVWKGYQGYITLTRPRHSCSPMW